MGAASDRRTDRRGVWALPGVTAAVRGYGPGGPAAGYSIRTLAKSNSLIWLSTASFSLAEQTVVRDQ